MYFAVRYAGGRPGPLTRSRRPCCVRPPVGYAPGRCLGAL